MKGDLAAIAAALGPDGQNCIAVVEPQLEISAIHRLLLARQVPGIAKVRLALGCSIEVDHLPLPEYPQAHDAHKLGAHRMECDAWCAWCWPYARCILATMAS